MARRGGRSGGDHRLGSCGRWRVGPGDEVLDGAVALVDGAEAGVGREGDRSPVVGEGLRRFGTAHVRVDEEGVGQSEGVEHQALVGIGRRGTIGGASTIDDETCEDGEDSKLSWG